MAGTILVIEDNFDVRDNLVELLTLDGYNVIEAENGRVGVKQALELQPDLILCDVMMPIMDGYGVLKIVSRNEKLMHIPFMFLTAKADKSDIRKGMGLGADDYITKPFNETELLEAIEIRMKKGEMLKEKLSAKNKVDTLFVNKKKAEADFQEFVSKAPIRQFLKKEEVFRLGQFARNVYIVEEGILKNSQYSEFGKELISDFYIKGDIFGFTDYTLGRKITSSVSVIKEAKLRLIPIEDFNSYLFKNKDFLVLYTKNELIRKLKAQDKLVDFAYASLREKVAKSLFNLYEFVFKDQEVIDISRADLAAHAGLAKETVIRTVSELKKDGIISVSGQKISVKDKLRLEAIFK
jgi:DNA-binding response OmpR family regulator